MALLDPKNKLARITWDTRRMVYELARAAGSRQLRVRSARRTCQEQRELYGIGRTYNLSSSPVTYADGCRSWHVLGRAVDLDVLSPTTGSPTSSCSEYERLGAIWEKLGGEWGGRWKVFGACGDAGHFQWRAGRSMGLVCPDPAACDQVAALVDAECVEPFPWLYATAGVAAGVALGTGLWLAVS